jgi:hypothetical protein
MDEDKLAGWIPLFLSARGGQPAVDWGYMGGERFVEPFCHDTLQKLASRPFNRLFRRQSGLDLLRERVHCHPGLPLKGIVFHMSRCGSTLAAPWERPAPVSENRLLAHGSHRPPAGGFSQHALDISLPRSAGGAGVASAHAGLATGAGFHDRPRTICPRGGHESSTGSGAWILSVILERAGQAMLRHENGLLLNYSELTQALDARLPEYFGIAPDSLDRAALRAVTGRQAKQPDAAFRADAAEKHAAADSEVIELAARWLNEPYQALERLRGARSI